MTLGPKDKRQDSKMALHVKELAAKRNGVSSIPGIHMVEGEN